MIRRKLSKRTRRRGERKQRRTDGTSPSLSRNPQNHRNAERHSSRFWINPQGKTVHWNCRTNCYTRRPRRFDKSVTAEAETITPERQQRLISFLEAKREVYQAKLRLRHALHDEDPHYLRHAKSRLQRTFSRRRRSWSLKSSQ